MLANRYAWLLFCCALYINAQLTYIQWSTGRQGTEQFDTLELMSHLIAVMEAAALGITMLFISAAGPVVKRWGVEHPAAPFPYFAYAVAVQLSAAFFMLLHMLLLMFPHSYPQLRTEGIYIPVMLLQRVILIMIAISVSANFGWLLRFYTRIPWKATALAVMLAQLALGYGTTVLSLRYPVLVRLNSIFYYNELWRYIPNFPNLQHANLFHNIQLPYYAYYLSSGLLLVLLFTVLWLPRAARLGLRERTASQKKALP